MWNNLVTLTLPRSNSIISYYKNILFYHCLKIKIYYRAFNVSGTIVIHRKIKTLKDMFIWICRPWQDYYIFLMEFWEYYLKIYLWRTFFSIHHIVTIRHHSCHTTLFTSKMSSKLTSEEKLMRGKLFEYLHS